MYYRRWIPLVSKVKAPWCLQAASSGLLARVCSQGRSSGTADNKPTCSGCYFCVCHNSSVRLLLMLYPLSNPIIFPGYETPFLPHFSLPF